MKLLLESSLSRLFRFGKSHDCGVMSAFTSYNNRKTNVSNHRKLGQELKQLGFSITQVIGGYQYGGEDEVSKELSWFICDKDDIGNLKKSLIEKGQEYDQESIFFAPIGKKPYLIWTRKSDNTHNVGDESDVSRSKTWGKRNPNSSAFTMVGGRKFGDDIEYSFKNKKIMENKSNRFKHNFDTVYESFYSRYTSALFTKGDIIEFDKAILNDPIFKKMPEEMRIRIEEMVEAESSGNAIIAIANICLPPFMADQYEPSSITLGYSTIGGMYYGQTTISGSLGQYLKIKTGIDSLVPKNAIRQYKSTERASVDMDSVKQAFKTGYARDIRKTGNKE